MVIYAVAKHEKHFLVLLLALVFVLPFIPATSIGAALPQSGEVFYGDDLMRVHATQWEAPAVERTVYR